MFLEYLDGSLGFRDIQRANNHIRHTTWISANVEVPTVSAILVGPFNRSPTERQMPPLQRLRTGQGGP